jgi:hypothetical protein
VCIKKALYQNGITMIPKRRLGKTNVDVTIIGLGGEGVLRTHGYEREAYELINRAIDLGINYFDSAYLVFSVLRDKESFAVRGGTTYLNCSLSARRQIKRRGIYGGYKGLSGNITG